MPSGTPRTWSARHLRRSQMGTARSRLAGGRYLRPVVAPPLRTRSGRRATTPAGKLTATAGSLPKEKAASEAAPGIGVVLQDDDAELHRALPRSGTGWIMPREQARDAGARVA